MLIAYIIWYMLHKVELFLNNQSALCCIHIINQALSLHRISTYYTGLELGEEKQCQFGAQVKFNKLKSKFCPF